MGGNEEGIAETVKEQLSPEEREAAEMFQRVNSASWIKNRVGD